jgi:hypothetical protein
MSQQSNDKRTFWVWALIGFVMPFVIALIDQILPTQALLVLWPAGFVLRAMHRAWPLMWARVALLVLAYAGNAAIYGCLALAFRRLSRNGAAK